MSGFSRLACGGCPPVGELMLALAAEFHAVDEAAAEERLDELARPLFGLPPRAAASTLSRVLGGFDAERAGVGVHVLSTASGWYAGPADGERMWLVDTTMDGRRVDAWRLRRHCAHEVAFAALIGLTERLQRAGDARGAGRAALLRRQLPLLRHSH